MPTPFSFSTASSLPTSPPLWVTYSLLSLLCALWVLACDLLAVGLQSISIFYMYVCAACVYVCCLCVCVIVRLVLVMTPVCCILGGIAASVCSFFGILLLVSEVSRSITYHSHL